jgi:hypothetical protein
LACGAEYACWQYAARRHSRNRRTNSNTGDGDAARKHGNAARKHGNAARKCGNAAGNSRDAAGQFSDSDHAATDDPRSQHKFAEDANPGQ